MKNHNATGTRFFTPTFSTDIQVLYLVVFFILFNAIISPDLKQLLGLAPDIIKELSEEKHAPALVWKPYNEVVQDKQLGSAASILKIDFSYSKNAASPFTITSMQKMNGYASNIPTALYDDNQETYTFEVVGPEDKVLHTTLYTPSNILMYENEKNGSKMEGGETELTKVSLSIKVPWIENGSSIKVKTESGKELATKPLSEAENVTNTPDFFILTSPEYTETDGYLDLVYIGDNYALEQLPQFRADVERFRTALLALEPFRSRSGQMRISYINNTNDLDCGMHGVFFTCDDQLVLNRVNQSGANWDKIGVIVNTGDCCGSARGGGEIAVSNNDPGFGQLTFAHEFGHALGPLWDEYDYGATEILTNQVHWNCYRGNPPAADWSNIVAASDYRLVCGYSNWYRSYPESLMSGYFDISFYNTASQRMLNNSLTAFSAPHVDTVAPTVAIIPNPNGRFVSGRPRIQVNATDNFGVAHTQLFKDNVFLTTGYPNLVFPAYLYPHGSSHTIFVKAYDIAGNFGQSTPITVTVCIGDLTGDGVVGSQDFSILRQQFGVCQGRQCTADLNGDEVVGSIDFSMLRARFGQGCT